MLIFEYFDAFDEQKSKKTHDEFEKYAADNGLRSGYKPFVFVAKEGDEEVGIIAGHTCYEEVHVANLIVNEGHRRKGIGSKLLQQVEEHFKGKGFEHINLDTFAFQAPKFYEKCGFSVEFVRKNKENEKLNRYFLAKYF